jgi:TonB family protein
MYAEIESDRNEQSIKALIFTLIITVGVILLLMFMNLYRPDPLPTEIVLELPLGFGDPDAGGGSGGATKTDVAVVQEQEESSSISEENVKEAPVVTTPNNVSVKPVNTNVNVKPNNNTKPINQNALFPGGGNEGEGGGNENGKGDGKGDKEGPGFGPGTKPGVHGSGGSDYVMEGRNAVSKPTLTDNFEEEGKVVVNVWIDQNGAVTRTSINESQTNTSSPKLRSIAEKAAKKWKYSSSTNASVEQKGIVIYKFVLK